MDEIKNTSEVSEAQKINEGAEALTKNLGTATDGITFSDAVIDAVEKNFDSKLDGTLNKNDGTNHFSPSFGMGCTELCRKTETKVGSYG